MYSDCLRGMVLIAISLVAEVSAKISRLPDVHSLHSSPVFCPSWRGDTCSTPLNNISLLSLLCAVGSRIICYNVEFTDFKLTAINYSLHHIFITYLFVFLTRIHVLLISKYHLPHSFLSLIISFRLPKCILFYSLLFAHISLIPFIQLFHLIFHPRMHYFTRL